MRKIASLLLVLLGSTGLNADPAPKGIYFLSWDKVKLETDGKQYKYVELDGFIEFEGETVFPIVRLWESREAMKYKRNFKHVSVDSVSLSNMLLKHEDSPSAIWKTLNGRYVRLIGDFKDGGLQLLRNGLCGGTDLISVASTKTNNANNLSLIHISEPTRPY